MESQYALADTSTGSSGHGFSAGLGFAVLHRSCGLPTKAFVIAGDAETEEGMSYEARNVASTLGVANLIVTLDYNSFGIDGPITEVHAVALPEPLVRAGLERHRSGRPQRSASWPTPIGWRRGASATSSPRW